MKRFALILSLALWGVTRVIRRYPPRKVRDVDAGSAHAARASSHSHHTERRASRFARGGHNWGQ